MEDGKISGEEYQLIDSEVEKYCTMKNEIQHKSPGSLVIYEWLKQDLIKSW